MRRLRSARLIAGGVFATATALSLAVASLVVNAAAEDELIVAGARDREVDTVSRALASEASVAPVSRRAATATPMYVPQAERPAPMVGANLSQAWRAVGSGDFDSAKTAIRQVGEALDPGVRPRWFVYAAAGDQAVGYSIKREEADQARSRWHAETIVPVGDAQLGVGWRKGALHASVVVADREVSHLGRKGDEQFAAFTLSIRPRQR